MSRKVFVFVLGMLVFSLITVSAKSDKATIHVQTFGYEGRDVLKLNVEITGGDSDYVYVTVDQGVLNKISKEINVENLPVVQVGDTMFKVPKDTLTEVGTHEYVIVVPNNVTKMKWSIKDKIKEMNGNDIVRVLVWFKEPGVFTTVSQFGNVTYEFLSGMGAVVDIRVSKIKALSEEAAIEFVEADEVAHIALSQSVPLINADDVWAMGYDGTGVSVCIIDTGIDPAHCDFPSGKITAWADYVNGCSNAYDDHGHGTHCASIAAGAASPKGVAPGASLMGAKVCTSGGSCPVSAIIQGVDFGVAQGADVESLSLTGPGGDGTSALAQECNWAVDQGVVVIVAAGNNGPSCCTIGTPGDATKVITVGASDKSDALASFSSRGPTTDDRVKPDITAPGVSIYAASYCTYCSDVSMSGTSMATPHIAGVAALMLDARGTGTPLQVKNCIGATAIDKGNTGKDCLWGWGRVDAYAAVNQIISNPNVSPPGDATDCGCTCGGGWFSSPPLFDSSPLSTPSVTIVNPLDGSEVYGTVNITVCAKGCFDTVEFYIDDVLEDTVTSWPFQYLWDTFSHSNGYHTIRVEGYYLGQFVDSDEITVLVNNGCVVITDPQEDESVSCTVLVTTNTSEEVIAVKFYINGVHKWTDNQGPSFEFPWDTCDDDYPNETYTITAEAFEDQLLTSSSEILDVPCGSDYVEVHVDNSCIEIINPQDGEDVYGTVDITASGSCCVNEVWFYIDGVLKSTEFGPYIYEWDTTDPEYEEDEWYTITVEGYYHGTWKCTESIDVKVNNYDVKITNPQNQEEVSGTVTITVDARGIDIVQFYFFEDPYWYCFGTDCGPPFEHDWDTTSYEEGEQYTICVNGFTNDQIPDCTEFLSSFAEQPEGYSLEPKATHCITVTVNNIYVKITNPQEGEEVSGIVIITTDANGIDTVKFYIDNDPCLCEDIEAPFECEWNTAQYQNGDHTITAEGYVSGELEDQDTVTCTICNGSVALFLGISFGVVGISKRRH